MRSDSLVTRDPNSERTRRYHHQRNLVIPPDRNQSAVDHAPAPHKKNRRAIDEDDVLREPRWNSGTLFVFSVAYRAKRMKQTIHKAGRSKSFHSSIVIVMVENWIWEDEE
ncbi:hypothetical protein L2E82_36505 [Cichorium intybus]|uniref:Uncharacterized protein n=1 Tax=Cichorium intybus TaxID=13427 RepID=A0ACB9BRZ9_CICIN|nr:hypothetical protein L2E82_36505 [Cichorium intybus]